MNRKRLPIVLAALALLASPAAFAAEGPALPLTQEEFVAALQAQPGAGGEQPELEGQQAPLFKHGTFCDYQGQACRGCTLPNGSRGLKSCEDQVCYYNGSPHHHYINCGACTTACAN